MKIRYFSDLHLEFMNIFQLQAFINKIPAAESGEVAVLAGDIGNPYARNGHYDRFMKWMSATFAKTFVIAGNHECYNKIDKTVAETMQFLQDYFKAYRNISFLDNTFEVYDGYTFIGTTLWTKLDNPRVTINDVKGIPKMDLVEHNRLHAEGRLFLEKVLSTGLTNCIVITHHVPSFALIHPNYLNREMEPYHQWFYADLETVMETHADNIKAWFYGHTHTGSVQHRHGIPCLCNPIGYPGESDRVDLGKTFDLNHS